ncbi:hypothetical protein SAY87_011797 [Trapa incisa]|uniref:Uncharacterized protein n=1 Tax=Trapa incisa TaxID=236973 RepID=A0AAN7GM29_9MYRT|nr:hypothetical protein SAY87_011797 [Trapa incisa]
MAVVAKLPPSIPNLLQIEDEDDLFEIDLDAADSFPPPRYYWGSHFTDNPGMARFANCLLPVADVTRAVPVAPVVTAASRVSVQPPTQQRDLPEAVTTLGKLLQLPYPKALVSNI